MIGAVAPQNFEAKSQKTRQQQDLDLSKENHRFCELSHEYYSCKDSVNYIIITYTSHMNYT